MSNNDQSPLERHSLFLFQHLICELCYFVEVPLSFWLHLVSLKISCPVLCKACHLVRGPHKILSCVLQYLQ